jgi:hypothetical protein
VPLPVRSSLTTYSLGRDGLQGGLGRVVTFDRDGSETKNSLPRYGWDREGTSPCHPRRLIRSRGAGCGNP